MKNKQGFLPNLLNKYGIRKLSAGTASLLIGATLVFGINGQVKAAETDNIVSQNGDNKTNDSESSDKELVKSEDDKTSSTSTDTNLESEFDQNNNPSSIEESTNRNDEDTLNQRTSTETEKDTHVKSADTQTTNETTNKNDDNATTNHTESISDESTYQSDDSKTTQHDNSNTNQDTQSTLNPTSKESSNKDEATSPTPKESTSIEKTNLSNDANHQTTDEVNHSDSDNMTNSTPNDTENELDTTQLTSHDESPSPQSDNFTGFTNLMATPLNLRNDNQRINLLAATEDTKPKTYKKPNNSEYSYLLNDLGYDATTVKENSDLRHAGISQSQDNTGSVIKLNLTKWLSLQSDFVNGGKVNLSFAQSDFYTQIESITLNDVKMDTTNNGQNWSAPINGSTVRSGLIGSVTNHDIVITLKNSQTLSSLGYSNNKPVYLTHTWTTNDGAIAEESIQVASITPTLDSKAPNTIQKSDFTAGRMTNKIKYDSSQNSIKSVHTFKPNENFLQTDYRAVLYIKEQVNKELIPYIDPNSVKLYVSDPDGNPISQDRYVNGSIDNDGLFDSSKINEISIKNNNTSGQLSNARTSLDRNVFFGTLGQSRSYTISYKLKDGYTLESVASKVSARETFDSWMEVDYLDSYDSGAPNKRLLGSYASSYIDMIDRIPPVAPKANSITTEDTSIKGTAEVDTNINLTFNDGRTLNGKVDSNGNFSIAIPSDYVLTGKETIKITSIDKGDNVSPAITISVIDKTPPAVKAISNKTQKVNTEIEPIKIEATDNSGQAVTNKVEGLPAGGDMTFDEATNTISGTPSEVGSYDITVTTTDENGNSETTTFTIDVEDTTKPTVESVADQTQEVNTEIEPIKIEATDNSGRAVTNKVDGLPDGVTFDEATNTISGTPSEVGSYDITVTTTDESGNVTETIFTIDVEDTTKPTVESIAGQTQEVNTEIEPIKIEAKDNSGQTVTNKVDGLPDGVTFDEATNTISGTPSEVGSYDVTVTTTDESGNSETTTFTIEVKDTTKPTVESVADQTQEVNTEIEPIKIEARDNSGQAVTNKVDGLPDGVTFDEATNTISGTPSEVGSYDITVTTTDESGNVTETTFTIEVEDTTKPTVENVADQTQEVNTEITPITIESEDNSGQTVTNKVDGLPDGVTFDETTNTISGTPSKVGSYDITVTTTDESGNATETTFTIEVEDTTKPTVENVAGQTQEINTEIEPIKIEATDNSGQAVTNKVEGLPAGVTFDEATNTISGTPSEVGSYTVTVTTMDESGNATETTFTIDVEDTTKPTVESVSDQTQEVNTEITPITIESEDNSDQAVTNKVDGLPDGVTFDEATNTISGTPSEVGSYTVTVTTTDESGNATETTFTIDVEDTTKPTVKSVSDQTQEVNTEITPIKIEATDNSGQTVTNKVDGLPDGITFDEATNTISGTPSEVGSYDITVTTTDESGNATETTFTINVEDTTKPTVEDIADQTQEVNTEIEPIKIEATDNGGQAVTNKVDGLPDGVTFDEATNTISGTPSEVGSYDIIVTTTDENGNSETTTFTIDVEDTTKPTVESVVDQTQEVNTEITPIKIEATDNSGQAVANKVDGLPNGVTFDETTNTISGTPSEVGSYTVTVTTTDESGNATETTFTIDVEDTTKPTVESVADQTQEVNTEITPITIESEDNSGQAVTNKVEGLPAGMTFDETTNTISGTPSEVGSYTVTVTTTDESGNETETTFTIDVEDTTKPTVESIANQTQEVNTEITPIKIEATDNSGQAVTNKVDGLPNGVTFDETTNTISGTPSEVGSYDIKVTTTDESGNATETTFTINVEDTTKPTVESVADQTQEINTEIEPIKIEARDNSGQAVTNKVDGLPDGVTFDEATNTISGTPSEVGSYDITVTTTDESGNATETTFTIDVEDTTKPTVEDITDQTQEINTEMTPIKIEATDNSGQAVTNKVEGLPDGVTFDEATNTISGTPSEVGKYLITITTIDKDGNTATTTLTINVIDTTTPEQPTINKVTENSTEVNGRGEPGTVVEVTFPDGNKVEGKVDSDGNYHIQIPSETTLKGGQPLQVIAIDKAGNKSEATTTNVIDTTAPEQPTINKVTENSTEVSGRGEPGTVVEVTFPDGNKVEGKVDSDGNYHIQIPSDERFKVGQQLIVKVVDEEGNVSEPSITMVQKEDKNSEKLSTVTGTVTKNNSKSLKHKASEQQSYHNKSEKIKNVNKPTKIVEKDMSTYDYSRYSKDISNKNNKSATFEQQNVSDINNNQYSRNKVNQPVKKSRKNEINKDLPQTGEENFNKSTLFGTLVASLGALLLFFKRRKKDENDEKE